MTIIDTIIVGGGQAGLASAYALRNAGLSHVVLHDGARPTGSWAGHYDSLTLFSPARHSALPGLPFPADPDHYPHRDEVVAYLDAYARHHDLPVRTSVRVESVTRDASAFVVHTATGEQLLARSVIAATGPFRDPYVPTLPGAQSFGGHILHASSYRRPTDYLGQRVIVVGAANTAVQVAWELSRITETLLVTRAPVRFAPQRVLGRDLHDWLTLSGLDRSRWLRDQSTPVLDTGRYRTALRDGSLPRAPMFDRFVADGVAWSDGRVHRAETVIFATGYRPLLPWLSPLGAAGPPADDVHDGISRSVPGLAYVGFSGQRSFSSATLRGVGRDAEHVARHLSRRLNRTARHIAPTPHPGDS